MVAYHHAFCRSLRIMGISITSVGMGKNELSTKETVPRAYGARLSEAARIIQSYSFRIGSRYSAAGGRRSGRRHLVKLMARRSTISLRMKRPLPVARMRLLAGIA